MLLLDLADNRDERTFVDAATAVDDAHCKSSQHLRRLAEDDDDAFLGLDVGTHEDGDMGFILRGIPREANFLKAFLF